MARRVFFSFHYDDVWRVNVVRKSCVTKDREVAGYWDASLWEEAETKGDAAIRRLIDGGLQNTSVTTVLIGKHTATRDYVLYEIEQSYERGNGLLGIYIHGIKDQDRRSAWFKGTSPFAKVRVEDLSKVRNEFTDKIRYALVGKHGRLSAVVPTYYWFDDNGDKNLGQWVEEAAQRAGR